MKRIKPSTFIICLSLLLIAALFTSSCSTEQAESKTLKLGLITSITGPTSGPLKSFYDAVGPTNELFNNMGGITVNGEQYQIEIIAADDQSTPQGAVTAAIKLLQDNIKFVSAPIFPVTLTSCTPTLEEAKIISACPSQLDPQPYIPENRYSFDCWATAYCTFSMFNYLQEKYPDVKRIALLTPDDPGPNFVLGITEEELPKRGMEIVAREKFPTTTEDFMPVVTKIMAEEPDAFMVAGIAPWVVGIVDSSRDLGFTGPVFGACPVGDMNQINAMIKPGNNYNVLQPGPDVLSDKVPSIVKDLRDIVQKENMEFTFDTAMPLGSIWPMLQAIEAAQSFDTDKVAETFEKMEVSTPWSDAKAKWAGEEYGYHHLLALDEVPIVRIAEGGKIEFEYVQR